MRFKEQQQSRSLWLSALSPYGDIASHSLAGVLDLVLVHLGHLIWYALSLVLPSPRPTCSCQSHEVWRIVTLVSLVSPWCHLRGA